MNELIGEINGTLEQFEKYLGRMEKALYGNGQPGVMDRITRMEENTENFTIITEKLLKEQAETVSKLICSVSELKDAVKKHVEDKNAHTLIGLTLTTNKKIIAGILIGFLSLHSIIEAIPDIGNVFKWLFGLMGL